MAKQQKIGIPAGETEYKQKVLFLRKSKKGAHLYAFNREAEPEEEEMILGDKVGSLLMDVSEVERLIAGSTEWIKVGIIPAGEFKPTSSTEVKGD